MRPRARPAAPLPGGPPGAHDGGVDLQGRDAGLGYRALLIDIDGTLLGEGDELTPRTRRAIDRVVARGIRVFLATGRSIHGALKVHEDLGLTSPLICYNGLVVYEPATGEWLHHHKLPDELVPELLDLARQKANFYFVFHDDRKYSAPYVNKVHEKMASTLKNVEQVPADKIPAADVTKINLYCKPGAAEEVKAFLGKWAEHVQVDVFPLSAIPAFRKLDLQYLDIQPLHDGKAQALDFLARTYGIPASAVIAFGDQVNDRPMLKKAGLGVSMGNAPPTLKKDAVLVIEKNTDDGVARFLDLLYPEEGIEGESGPDSLEEA